MNTHIINKQIIELKVNSEENAFGLQQQARDAYMSNVLPLISEVLDELAGPDEVLRIDRLELDFGVLSIDKLGQQMKERVREAFLKQLPDLRQKKTNNEKLSFSVIETVAGGKKSLAQVMTESFSQRELLAVYFETGILPWWATDEIDAPDIDVIITSLVEKEPVSTIQWLQQLAVTVPHAIRRMVLQIEKSTRNQLLAAFPEKIITTLRSLTAQIQQAQNGVNQFPWQNDQGDALLFSALILPPEVSQGAVSASGNKIIETLIAQLATVYRADQQVVEKQLYAATVSGIVSSRYQAEAVPDLAGYFAEWEKKNPEIAYSVTESNFPAIEFFSEHDHLSITELVETIEKALKEFEVKHAAYLSRRKRELVKKKKQSPLHTKPAAAPSKETKTGVAAVDLANDELSAEENFTGTASVNEFEAPTIEKIGDVTNTDNPSMESEENNLPGENAAVTINWFKTTDPQSKPERISSKEELNTIHQATKQEKGAEVSKPVINKEEATAIPDAAKIHNEQPAEMTVEEEEMEFEEEHPLLKKKPSAGMTRFGGLVLVGPFLPAFFAELKLVVDGKFRGDAEQYKALHLLNYMASGKTSAPEYALLLHKLLCGIELTKPVPKTVKLTAAEKKETMLFLDDIAGQWTALRSTSGEAFRDTFFRRNGILEKKESMWLLRIERGPMDIMLDTLPWTISILKAPWMPQLLQTEW